MLVILLYLICTFEIDAAPSETTKSSLSGKIAGGVVVTDRTKFFFQVSLGYVAGYTCGGVIIAETFVATAAHCCKINVRGNIINPTHVVVGNLKKGITTPETRKIDVLEVIVHEKYDGLLFINDIALLRTKNLGPFNAYVNKIEIHSGVPPDGTICTVSGWGKTCEKSSASILLRSLEVPLVNIERCNRTYAGDLISGTICAGYYNQGTKDACPGDSGGPLVCQGKLIGLVSFGGPCKGNSVPGGYADVVYFTDWIKNKMKIHFVEETVDENHKRNDTETDETDADGRVAGGGPVSDPTKFYYQASLRYTDKLYTCGGVVIDEFYVLTAAHCCTYEVENVVMKPTNVVVGSLKRDSPSKQMRNKKVLDVIVHEKYDRSSEANDIALLRTESFGTFNSYVNKIELCTTTPPDGTICVVSGWGTTNDKPIASNELRSLELPMVNQARCNKTYLGDVFPGTICAGFFNQGTKDACQGDSGGPLACGGKLAGLVSFGGPCQGNSIPGGYVDVAYYHKWIKSKQATHKHRNGGYRTALHDYIKYVSPLVYIIFVTAFQ